MRRELHALVLALAGGALVKLAATGTYVRYVKAGVRPLLFAAAATMLIVAALSLWQAVRSRREALPAPGPVLGGPELGGPVPGELPPDDHPAHHGADAHGHAHGGPDVAWLLVIPMLALLLIAPPALGSFSAARAGTALGAAQTSDLPPLPSGNPVRMSVLDYASRAIFDKGRSLDGRTMTLSGFLVPDGNGGWYLTRMVITCCAADAQPIKVGLTGAVPAGLKANDWLEVIGAYTPKTVADAVNGEAIPYLQVASSRPIPAPAQQYES